MPNLPTLQHICILVNKKAILAYVIYLRKFKELSKAVQLVAIAKLKKLSKALDKRDVSLSISSSLFEALNAAELAFNRCTVVVITSERSCCGKLNNDVISSVKDSIEEYLDDNKQLRIISVG